MQLCRAEAHKRESIEFIRRAWAITSTRLKHRWWLKHRWFFKRLFVIILSVCFLNVRFLRRWTSFNLFLPDVDASVSQLSLNGVRFPESAFPDRYDKRSFAKKKKSVFEFGVVQKFANITERCNEPSKKRPCNNWWSFMLMTSLTIEERQCPSASESLGRIWILFYVDWINFGSQNRDRRALFFLLLSCAEILPYYFFARWCFQGVRKHEKTKPIANCRQPSAVFVSFWNEESADPTFDAGKVRKCPVWVSSFVWVLVAKVEEDKLIKPTELSFCSSCVHIRLHFILPSVILFKAAATVFAADPMKVSLPSTSMQLIKFNGIGSVFT